MMSYNIADPEVPVIYVPKTRSYGILMVEGVGGGNIEIYYCPWCGRRLPEDLCDALLEEVESVGLDFDSPELPAKYESDAWWKEKGL